MTEFKTEIKKDLRESGFNVHKKYDRFDVPGLKEICREDQKPYAVCALSITGDLNIGSMIRTASLCGAQKFLIVGRRVYDRRGAVGAQNYIQVDRIAGLTEDTEISAEIFKQVMEDYNYKPIFIEQGGTPVHQYYWPGIFTGKTPCLIFGNENRGIPDDVLQTGLDLGGSIVSIPQKGVIRSHNVSIASGIVMFKLVESMGWW